MTKIRTNVEGHYSTKFDLELENLKHEALKMGQLIESQLENTITALSSGDKHLAEVVIKNEEIVDQMEVSIDHKSIQELARRQPLASDLRFVVAILKTVNDLERIGDEICNLSKMSVGISESEKRPDIYEKLQTMANAVLELYQEAFQSFLEFDMTKAMAVIQNDSKIDQLYKKALRHTIRGMKKDSDYVKDAVDIIWALKALERIGDRSCNICEHVVYFVIGKDIRHKNLVQLKQYAKKFRPRVL